jgi:FlaA1/EpsC-like NDP-sugar epimerase
MKRILLNKIVIPRWIILVMDLCLAFFSFSLSYLVVKYFLFEEMGKAEYLYYTTFYCLSSGITFYFMRIHTGLIRYSNVHDMLRIFIALSITSALYPLVVVVSIRAFFSGHTLNLFKVLFINFFIASSLLILSRTAIKGLYFYLKRFSSSNVDRVLIYGSDLTSILIKETLESADHSRLKVAGFLDSNPAKTNTVIQQVRVYPVSALPRLYYKTKIDKLIMPSNLLASGDLQLIVDQCLELSIRVYTVPPSDQWIYGKLCLTQIKDLKIEDLLQRDPILIDNEKIAGQLAGKRVLVTGAAGSIGSEIARQVMKYGAGCVVLCDQAESSLHEFQLEMEEKFGKQRVKAFLGSIQNHDRMALLFQLYEPQIVFHAAAYKHVPMMEHHPAEAVMTNVLGTKNLADMAILHEVEKFVMISTDKAVNPTNVMGTSKRIAEKYVQSLDDFFGNEQSFKTKFITTRFGNVLGSNGSVIPRFYKQIQNGGPVTVTDPEITRYFMTIPEAVQLVLEACTMGHGGEIFVFDMGKPVKIVELARKMIRLTGLVPEKDIKIEFTGLRPGEKLFEELLSDVEKTIPTYHEK